MLQRTGRVDGLVLEVQVDSPAWRQREGVQMRVGRAILVGLDATNRLVRPLPRAEAPTTVPSDGHERSVSDPKYRWRRRCNRAAPRPPCRASASARTRSSALR